MLRILENICHKTLIPAHFNVGELLEPKIGITLDLIRIGIVHENRLFSFHNITTSSLASISSNSSEGNFIIALQNISTTMHRLAFEIMRVFASQSVVLLDTRRLYPHRARRSSLRLGIYYVADEHAFSVLEFVISIF